MAIPKPSALLRDRLFRIELSFGQAFLWADDDGLTLVDSGGPGAADEIVSAIERLGRRPEELSRILLTHFHVDHTGGTAELVRRYRPLVYAHRVEVPYLRHEQPVPMPVLLDWERPLFEQVVPTGEIAAPEPIGVDRALEDGEAIAGATPIRALWIPGHTPGSVAYHLPEQGVVFTGDTVARGEHGHAMPGVFDVDRTELAESVARLATLDVTIACFGHGDPAVGDAAEQLRYASREAEPTG